MSNESTPRPKRGRLFRYSLRTLLLAVTLLAVALAYSVSDFAKERAAVEAILAHGGRVVYFDNTYGFVHPERTPIAWAREFVRLRWPHGVYFDSSYVDDDIVRAEVLPLHTLVYVGIRGGRVTNEGLAQLASLESLVGVTCIRDSRNEKVLKELGQPTHMDFRETPLEDAVDYLKDLHGIDIRFYPNAIPPEQLDGGLPLSATIKNKTLGDALTQLLSPHDLGWIVRGGELQITTRDVQKKHEEKVAKVKAALPQWRQLLID